jgi:hypothetical protein
MTLLQTEEGRNVLIDCRIRDGEEHPDVLTELRKRLPRDEHGRLYVHLFIWTHPDSDHCDGVRDHFHLGKPDEWSEKTDKIFINEIWSSPMVFRRHSRTNHLCEDARALNTEVKRRIEGYRTTLLYGDAGDQVLVLGNDEDGKTDDIQAIVLQLDSVTEYINHEYCLDFQARLLGPSPRSDMEEKEEELGKNHSSAIFNIRLKGGNKYVNFLTGGDAEVACWEVLQERLSFYGRMSYVDYDLLQTPHHCSWRSLSWDSSSGKGDDAETSAQAMDIFSRAKERALIIASSKTIQDDDNDPPSYRAKLEYGKIVDEKDGQFLCVADHKSAGKNVPLEIEITDDGFKALSVQSLGMGASGSAAVNRQGGGGYA